MSGPTAGGRGDEGIRSFLALEVPGSVKERLAEAVATLRAELPRASWVSPEGVHLTLKFLGEVSRSRLDRLVNGLAPVLAEAAPVAVRLAGAGVFPNPARARVAWVGGEAPGAVEVAAAVEDAAAAVGIARERRRWSLHLTVARLRSPWPPAAVERFLEWGRGWVAEPFASNEVVLFASRLTPQGAVYTPLERVPLGGRES